VSFVVVTVRSRLIGFDRSIEEAAQDLGANGIQTFFRVTLPLIAPAVLAAARVSIPPQVKVLAAMIFLFTLVMMIFTVWQQRRAERLAAVRPEEG
jgi:ABC-type spermidine/putrescine transport system permease subunit II